MAGENDLNGVQNEKLYEALLKAAVDESAIQEINSLPSDEELNRMYPRSASLDKRIASIIKKAERGYKKKRLIRTITKTAASLAILFTISAITLLSLEDYRHVILNQFSNNMNHLPAPEMAAGVQFDQVELVEEVFEEAELFGRHEYAAEIADEAFSAPPIPEAIDAPSAMMDVTRQLPLPDGTYISMLELSPIYINGRRVYLHEAAEGESHVILWIHEDSVMQIISDVDLNEFLELVEDIID